MTINYGKREPGALTAASPGDTLYIPFPTFNDSGASIGIGGTLAVTDIEIFKNGNATARATDSGYSLISDTGQYGDRVGLHRFSISLFNTSDDTGFFDEGSQYHVAVDSITVDGRTVRFFPAVFEIGTPTVNVTQVDGDTGFADRLGKLASLLSASGQIDTGTIAGGFIPANVRQVNSDTGAASQLGQAFATTPTYFQQVDVQQIDGDTGPADNLGRIAGDTGAGSYIANVIWDEPLTGGSHNVSTSSGRRLRTLQASGTYEQGAIWVDTGDGVSGTTLFENGTVTAPVPTLSDALTISAASGLKSFHFQTQSNITLATAFAGYIVIGDNYTLSLGGQDISGTIFEKFGPISDSGVVSGAPAVFNSGPVGVVWVGPSIWIEAGFTNDDTGFNARSAGNFFFFDCKSQVEGENAPAFDFSGTGSATTAQFRRWSGGLNITLDSDCTVSVDAVSGGNVTVNGTGGSISIRGMVAVVDNSAGAVTITQTQVINRPAIADAVWDESDTGHSDTGTFGRLRQGVNVKKIVGDTGAATHLAQLADEYDTGRLNASVDTGQVNQAVWTADGSRTLTSWAFDTGVQQKLDRYDTGSRAAISALSTLLSNVDTGLSETIDAIQAKTDSLTFTVAGFADANIQYVNDVLITGTGDTGTADTWRPA